MNLHAPMSLPRLFKDRAIRLMRLTAVVLLVGGCRTHRPDSGGQVCSESEAKSAALGEAERRWGQQSYDTRASYEDGRWTVVVWRLPATPGGFVLVHVSDCGKVVDAQPGH